MTSTAGAWSSLFHGLPNRTPASSLYTEEAIQNEQLTADQVIEKAQSGASLLLDMVAALEKEHQTLRAFEQNDLVQTLHTECKEMSDYLYERIWHDSSDPDYFVYDSSSSKPQKRTVDEEAQMDAFRRYDVLKDYLQAKEMQEEENARSLAFEPSFPVDNEFNTGAKHSATGHFGDGEDEEDDEALEGPSIEGHERQQHYLRKSGQPLVWQLDPREDFKANKAKNKKRMDKAEKDRLERERMLERSPRNGIHGLTPEPVIPPEMLFVDEMMCSEHGQEENDHCGTQDMATIEANEDNDYGLEKINNRMELVEELDEKKVKAMDNDDEDDEGMFSDDSWEEIPESGIVGLSVEEEVAHGAVEGSSTVSSSTSSSILITTAGIPSLPSASMREL
ncbi:hypothetical protein BGX28_010314 [Mortierella sp. GBA30]|nr:hypothetical protein BGX28_010314 [Mortierella sp. GBA30]